MTLHSITETRHSWSRPDDCNFPCTYHILKQRNLTRGLEICEQQACLLSRHFPKQAHLEKAYRRRACLFEGSLKKDLTAGRKMASLSAVKKSEARYTHSRPRDGEFICYVLCNMLWKSPSNHQLDASPSAENSRTNQRWKPKDGIGTSSTTQS